MNETRRVVYIHPKGYYAVVERCGESLLGGKYKFRETIYPPFPWQKNKPKSKPKPQPIRTVTVDHVMERDKAQFEKLYKQGCSIHKIAEISGWSYTTVFRHLTAMGALHEKKKVTASEKAQMKEMAQNGISIRKIAAATGFSKYTVYKHLYR